MLFALILPYVATKRVPSPSILQIHCTDEWRTHFGWVPRYLRMNYVSRPQDPRSSASLLMRQRDAKNNQNSGASGPKDWNGDKTKHENSRKERIISQVPGTTQILQIKWKNSVLPTAKVLCGIKLCPIYRACQCESCLSTRSTCSAALFFFHSFSFTFKLHGTVNKMRGGHQSIPFVPHVSCSASPRPGSVTALTPHRSPETGQHYTVRTSCKQPQMSKTAKESARTEPPVPHRPADESHTCQHSLGNKSHS